MKAPEAFRSISEVAAILDVPQHRLRAWEARFPFVKPVKRPDGRRYYRPSDVAMLTELKRLLAEDTLSTEDIARIHRAGGFAAPRAASGLSVTPDEGRRAMRRLRDHLAALTAVRARLAAVLG
jgi:DNA-binding transcriptional MerR regulator